MKDHRRPPRPQRLLEAERVLHVADDVREPRRAALAAELLLELVEPELARVERDQLRGLEPDDLPAQLGADRAAGAGHEHRAPAQPAAQPLAVELDRVAPEQIVELHPPQLRDGDLARHQVLVGRHRHRRHVRLAAEVDRAASLRVRAVRHRDHRELGVLLLDDLRQASEGAEHFHALDLAAAGPGVVVQQPDEVPLGAAAEALQQVGRGGVGPEDDAPASRYRSRGAGDGPPSRRGTRRGSRP